jgi:cytochrome c5
LWLVTACAGARLHPPAAAHAPAPGSRAAVQGGDPRQGAHVVLVRHCGECHQGGHAGAPAEALTAFDLDRPDWAERFDARLFVAALQRFADKPPADVEVFATFRDAELARR